MTDENTTPGSPAGRTAPGWYADPSSPGQQRYWDGSTWSDRLAPAPGSAAGGGGTSKTNGLGIASFILSLLYICGIGSLIGVILGHVSLGQIKRERQGGRGLALAGLILGYIGLLGTAVLIVVTLVGASSSTNVETSSNGVRSNSGNKTNPPQNDVTISSCDTDSMGDVRAEVTVLNNSSKRSNYIISVAFESDGGSTQLDTTTVFVNGVEPGQTARDTGFPSFKKPNGAFTCRITDVSRFASS